MYWSDNTDFTFDEMIEACDRTHELMDEVNSYLLYIADYIISSLKSVGFIIQRYDAYSTNSIYLKLDYGMCNTIRISDHKGKSYLKYRYNLIVGLKESYNIIDKYPRYYYNESDIVFMLDKIILDRDSKLMKYGTCNYVKYMEKNKTDHATDTKGFWSQARLV